MTEPYKWIDGRYVRLVEQPGYFGKSKNKKIAKYNSQFGRGNWTIVWSTPWGVMDFFPACRYLYERSYYEYLKDKPEDLEFITSFREVIDNDVTNVDSGCDYLIQEAKSTHIQDIAVRNILNVFNLEFKGVKDELLVIRGHDSNGYKYGPGNVPFLDKKWILQNDLKPEWANEGSVEHFWQANKWIASLSKE